MSALDKFKGPQSQSAPEHAQDWRREFTELVERDAWNWGIEDYVINYWPGKETFEMHFLFSPPGYKVVKNDTGAEVPLRFDFEVSTNPDLLGSMSPEGTWNTLLEMLSVDVASNDVNGVTIVRNDE